MPLLESVDGATKQNSAEGSSTVAKVKVPVGNDRLPTEVLAISLPQIVISIFVILGGFVFLQMLVVPKANVAFSETRSAATINLLGTSSQTHKQGDKLAKQPTPLPHHISEERETQLSGQEDLPHSTSSEPTESESETTDLSDASVAESDPPASPIPRRIQPLMPEPLNEVMEGFQEDRGAGTVLAIENLRGGTRPRTGPTKQTTVDIVVLTDANYAMGAAAIINAARRHTSMPVRVYIGFDGEPSVMEAYLDCVGVSTDGVTVRRSVPLFDSKDMPEAAVGRER